MLNQRFIGLLLILLLLSGSFSVLAQGRSNEARNNCPLTSDAILGQAFGSTAGAEGEFSDAGLTPDGEDIVAEGLAMNPEWVMETLPFNSLGSEQVAILVLDDFSSEADAELLSHGWLVYEIFEALLAETDEATAEMIQIIPVNIADQDGFSQDLIVPRLQETLDELSQTGVDRFVVNMSFVFIPCEDRSLGFNFNEFRQSRRNNPELSLVRQVGGNPDYVESLLNDPRIAYIESNNLNTDVESRIAPQANARAQLNQERQSEGQENPERGQPPQREQVPGFEARELAVLRLFDNRQLQEDPLRDFLRDTPYFIVPVASAGNFKQQLPFYPARWPEVISVSADEGDDLRFWLNSNNGEITVPGAWHLFGDGAYRAGTSFAAPVLSLLIALDLTQSTPGCAVDADTLNLAHGNFDNRLLNQAVTEFCQP